MGGGLKSCYERLDTGSNFSPPKCLTFRQAAITCKLSIGSQGSDRKYLLLLSSDNLEVYAVSVPGHFPFYFDEIQDITSVIEVSVTVPPFSLRHTLVP